MTNSSRATQRIMKHEDAVKGAKFNSDESLILTWSDDQTARIWHTEDGSPAIPPMKHNGAVLGGTFCKSDSLILTWSNDGTARLWNVGTDYDFPKNYLPLLVEVVTGTKMDDDGKISVLGADEWNAKKQNYIEIAEKHLKECKYKNANLYLKQKEVWESN
jgi:WD40 repeat protein